jgi:hypothetical protein
MSKYQFHRMNGETFQQMVQALLERKRRDLGSLIQFPSAGADGGREATWTQPPDHPDYTRPEGHDVDIPRIWVFQVKFHDVGLRGWAGAASALLSDLRQELEKITNKHKVNCHSFVLITNVPLTGARHTGTRDSLMAAVAPYLQAIPDIQIWDASDISRMLDDNSDVRAAYLDLILPGDVFDALIRNITVDAHRREASLRGYLQFILTNESKARADEAGDDDSLPLTKVFIDQSLQLDRRNVPDCCVDFVSKWTSNQSEGRSEYSPADMNAVPSSFAVLWGGVATTMLLAGPGYGKSTITQFLSIYHAARILGSPTATQLAERLQLPKSWGPKHLDASCDLRIPFRIELRRYAKWRKSRIDEKEDAGIARYIAKQLIGGAVECSMDTEDVFSLISTNPAVLILDGLDEVPYKADRDAILKDMDAFLFRSSGENADLQVVLSSRPQGYNGEFDRFQPLRWVINDLKEPEFMSYCNSWLSHRVKRPEERSEAEERISRGMTSDAVKSLATTLLQATVMLTIVRRKNDIPEERHRLFAQYVDVVFQREKSKNELIAQYEHELRLLHELVGYRIHEAVGRGEAGAMTEDEFKEVVLSVWRRMRGAETFSGVLNQEIEKIFALATDRLVFLSGKGESQSDIDFVIQPYREYFAATYMTNHTAAEPDMIMSALVARGAYWQQVLRFYAALALPARQFAWICQVCMTYSVSDKAEVNVGGLRSKRAVLFVIPEFVRLDFEAVRKTIGGIMPVHEWWAWLHCGWILPILMRVRSGDAWRELWKLFRASNTRPFGSVEFAIWLFPKVVRPLDPEYSEVAAFVSSVAQSDRHSRIAIEAILTHGIPADLQVSEEEVYFAALKEVGSHDLHQEYKFDKLLALLPDRAVRQLCTVSAGRGKVEPLAWKYIGIKSKSDDGTNPDVSGEAFIEVSRPYWMTVCLEVFDQDIYDEANGSEVKYARYLAALYAAWARPSSVECHENAKRLEAQLPEKPSWEYLCETVLGPSPCEFASGAEWVGYKKLLSDSDGRVALFRDLDEVARTFPASEQREWLTLLFPPSQWDELEARSLVSSDTLLKLRNKSWLGIADCKVGVGSLLTLGGDEEISSDGISSVLIEVLAMAVELHNSGRLRESDVAGMLFGTIPAGQHDPTSINEVLAPLERLEMVPPCWASAFMDSLTTTRPIDPKMIARLWKESPQLRDDKFWMNFGLDSAMADVVDALAHVIGELVVEDVSLVADIVAQSMYGRLELTQVMSKQVNSIVCTELMSPNLQKERAMRLASCLLRTTQSVEEAALYADAASMARISEFGLLGLGLAERLKNISPALQRDELLKVEEILTEIVGNREQYPVEIGPAALHSLIQVDVARKAPLSDSDWQIAPPR